MCFKKDEMIVKLRPFIFGLVPTISSFLVSREYLEYYRLFLSTATKEVPLKLSRKLRCRKLQEEVVKCFLFGPGISSSSFDVTLLDRLVEDL